MVNLDKIMKRLLVYLILLRSLQNEKYHNCMNYE